MRRMFEIDAPAHWASYLVNGDDSGMDALELRECIASFKDLPFTPSDCVSVSDDTFTGRFNFSLQGSLGCTLATYTFMYEGDK